MHAHSRGSLWNRWDLHLHTPASDDYQDKGVTNQQIVDGLTAKGVRATRVVSASICQRHSPRRSRFRCAMHSKSVSPSINVARPMNIKFLKARVSSTCPPISN